MISINIHINSIANATPIHYTLPNCGWKSPFQREIVMNAPACGRSQATMARASG